MKTRNGLIQYPMVKIQDLKTFTLYIKGSQPELKQWLVNNNLTIVEAHIEAIPVDIETDIQNMKFMASNGVTYNFTANLLYEEV
jgi:hypothetical protein